MLVAFSLCTENLTLPSIGYFRSIRTAGQRCTTYRTLSAYDKVLEQLLTSYKQVKIGDPLEKGTLLGPLHTPESRNNFEKGIEGGKVLTGGKAIEGEGNFVEPTKLEISSDAAVVKEELFAPSFEEVVVINNSGKCSFEKPQSFVLQSTESRPMGSDCGIVKVNIPTNEDEIGGAFGATGGGREAGSNTCKHLSFFDWLNRFIFCQYDYDQLWEQVTSSARNQLRLSPQRFTYRFMLYLAGCLYGLDQ
ncbi:LOW QUALITY PROTEIN: hypothetical protein HID58_070182 [Brassica napus]|uniref:Aldehyde dehydrogenase domain-containing protein n=1 Tax=Brassica napus TaxID=3708 RepID=A0ABQ7YY29_BRANA|nr:LOW QUALITY PROTEIN: hypothetical protein HID58_070182 [Brassica napus]